MRNTDRDYGLFPPKDFIPTAVVFGFWVSGVLAGVNFIRLGLTQRGKRLITASIAVPLIFLGGGMLVTAVLGRGVAASVGLSPLWWGTALIGNGLIGYALYRAQRDLYVQWTGRHQVGREFRDPYVSPAVRALILLAILSLYVAIGVGVAVYTSVLPFPDTPVPKPPGDLSHAQRTVRSEVEEHSLRYDVLHYGDYNRVAAVSMLRCIGNLVPETHARIGNKIPDTPGYKRPYPGAASGHPDWCKTKSTGDYLALKNIKVYPSLLAADTVFRESCSRNPRSYREQDSRYTGVQATLSGSC